MKRRDAEVGAFLGLWWGTLLGAWPGIHLHVWWLLAIGIVVGAAGGSWIGWRVTGTAAK